MQMNGNSTVSENEHDIRIEYLTHNTHNYESIGRNMCEHKTGLKFQIHKYHQVYHRNSSHN